MKSYYLKKEVLNMKKNNRYQSRKFLFCLLAWVTGITIVTIGVFTLKAPGQSYISDAIWFATFSALLALPIHYNMINVKQKKEIPNYGYINNEQPNSSQF